MNKPKPPRVLFVCLGNICRSPTAEAVMRKLAPDWELDSAGTAGWHAGDPPYPPMVQAAAARGIDVSSLRARQFTQADFQVFDVIVAMDSDNLDHIQSMAPDDGAARHVLLMDFAPHTGAVAVPDPYYTRDFETAIDLIEAGCQGLLENLTAP